MNYVIVDRGDQLSTQLAEQFRSLVAGQLTYSEEEPELVISIGGDGTLLKAFHTYFHRIDVVEFIGIHTGHLGFFADWQADELEHLVNFILHSQAKRISYPLAKIELTTKDGIEQHYVLNEFTAKSTGNTLVAQVDINNVLFEMFRGDGIVVSTPSGSTAYNKSVGGAVIHPSLEVIQLAEVASINNRVFRTLGSSAVLPKHHFCDIKPIQGQTLHLSFDHIHMTRSDIISIRCRVADCKVNFARYRPFPFWTRVREAFMGDDTLQ